MWNQIERYYYHFSNNPTRLLQKLASSQKKDSMTPEDEGDTHYHLHFHLPDFGLGW